MSRCGVLEYLVWRVAEGRFDWLRLEHDEYVAQEPDAQGWLHSRAFAGLGVPLAALLTFDAAQVLAAAGKS